MLWQSSLSYSDSASTSKGLKALAAAFVVKARNPEVFRISFSSLLSVCTRRLACPEREARFIKFNPSLGWKYTINRPTGSLFEDQMAKQRGSWDRLPVLIRSLLRSLQPPQAASSNRECHATTTVCLTVINLIQQWNLKRAWDTRKLLPGIVRNYLWFKEKSDPDKKRNHIFLKFACHCEAEPNYMLKYGDLKCSLHFFWPGNNQITPPLDTLTVILTSWVLFWVCLNLLG